MSGGGRRRKTTKKNILSCRGGACGVDRHGTQPGTRRGISCTLLTGSFIFLTRTHAHTHTHTHTVTYSNRGSTEVLKKKKKCDSNKRRFDNRCIIQVERNAARDESRLEYRGVSVDETPAFQRRVVRVITRAVVSVHARDASHGDGGFHGGALLREQQLVAGNVEHHHDER